MFKKLLTILVIAYLCVGGIIWLVEPKPSETEALSETATGIRCLDSNLLWNVAAWPLSANYYWGGGYDACLKTLYRAPTSSHKLG